ncbi:MAG: hypothetical protein H8E44_00465 [Planctomycetes bacterium]|nr:hypothetical protein [Planctomycetota bacterium]
MTSDGSDNANPALVIVGIGLLILAVIGLFAEFQYKSPIPPPKPAQPISPPDDPETPEKPEEPSGGFLSARYLFKPSLLPSRIIVGLLFAVVCALLGPRLTGLTRADATPHFSTPFKIAGLGGFIVGYVLAPLLVFVIALTALTLLMVLLVRFGVLSRLSPQLSHLRQRFFRRSMERSKDRRKERAIREHRNRLEELERTVSDPERLEELKELEETSLERTLREIESGQSF